MFSQYFGNYLLNNGLLTDEQLTNCLRIHQSTHVKLGVIAVDKNYLTPAQVEKIHEVQRTKDMLFGEIAVSLGYLTDQQVEEMLSTQKNNHLQLAQTIVNLGYLTIEDFSIALNDYKNKYSLSDERFNAIKDGNIDAIVQVLLSEQSVSAQKYSDYITLFLKNTVRFIDTAIHLELVPFTKINTHDYVVRQQITGYQKMDTFILSNEEVFIQMASRFAQEELNEVDELAQASVSEFLNLHNGIYLVNQSNKGIELTMNPQEIYADKGLIALSANALKVLIYTSFGNFELIICDDLQTLQLQ